MDDTARRSGEPHLELAEMKAGAYRVCRDSHDPRGWPVRTQDDRELGKVSDLIVDEVALNARYLVCRMSLDARRVLIPTGFARLDERSKVVHLDFITRLDLNRLPAYQGLPLTPDQQLDLETALTLRPHVETPPIIHRRQEERSPR